MNGEPVSVEQDSIQASEPIENGERRTPRVPVLVRATIYGISYIGAVMVGLPYLFARWLGAGGSSLAEIAFGSLLAASGLALFLWCVVLFVLDGQGTQSPIEPPRAFVAVGPYRYVRNPMLLGNLIVLLGEAVLFSSRGIFIFSLFFFACCHLILLQVEEPSLRRRFGPVYEEYGREVPRWLPRRERTWRGRHGS